MTSRRPATGWTVSAVCFGGGEALIISYVCRSDRLLPGGPNIWRLWRWMGFSPHNLNKVNSTAFACECFLVLPNGSILNLDVDYYWYVMKTVRFISLMHGCKRAFQLTSVSFIHSFSLFRWTKYSAGKIMWFIIKLILSSRTCLKTDEALCGSWEQLWNRFGRIKGRRCLWGCVITPVLKIDAWRSLKRRCNLSNSCAELRGTIIVTHKPVGERKHNRLDWMIKMWKIGF